jgi:hypothetical protein
MSWHESIHIDASGSLDDVAARLGEILQSAPQRSRDREDERFFDVPAVHVWFQPDLSETLLDGHQFNYWLIIRTLGSRDPRPGRREARRIFRALAAATPWALGLMLSDDESDDSDLTEYRAPLHATAS